jgi:hypothetical protein
MFARKLARNYDLLVVARRQDRLQELAKALMTAPNTRVEICTADLTNDQDVASLAARLSAEPRLGLLVNNAGFGTKGRFWETTLDSQMQMHQLHVMTTVRLTHAALENMVPRNEGAVINVASVAGFVRRQGSVSYCATKSWMNIFTEGLYLELKSIGSRVKVQTVCPGYTYSEFHDKMAVQREMVAGKGFWLTPEQVVDASLSGLERGQLYVIPGWRYRLLTALVSKLPSRLRIGVESMRKAARADQGATQ